MQIKAKRNWLIIGGIAVAIMVTLVTIAIVWYQSQLNPYNPNDPETVRIEIKKGMSGSDIAANLEKSKVIKSAFIMNIYMRLHNQSSGFQVGVYSVSPSQPVKEIVAHLTSGKADELSITFYPGAMLQRYDKKSPEAKYDVYTALSNAGYSDAEIESALNFKYSGPVFAGRPSGEGIEGYVYGDTFFVQSGASATQVIQRSIDQLEQIVQGNNLEAKFKARGLTLYQGITLASIIERESIGCPGQAVCEDQQKIASVFYNRLNKGMTLGSDVTYHYAADLSGQARDFKLDSPYNTRIHAGLPPGPIASPGLSALNAAADPAQTDYLFFLSGDDDVTYFAKTDAEHNSNISGHCQMKCQLP